MTKRLTIALVAVALFVLLAVMPVSAVTTTNSNGTVIETGATVFIGEEHLNLTHAINKATNGYDASQLDQQPGNLTLGWWASAAQITTSAPTKSISLAGTRYRDFTVSQADFVGYTGNWYLLKSDGQTVQTGTGTTPVAVINVQDPTLSVAVWDFQQSKDITGMSITQGEHLGVQVNTNMYTASQTTLRNNTIWSITPAAPGLIPINGTNVNNGTFQYTTASSLYSESSGMASNVFFVVQYSGTFIKSTYDSNYYLGTWYYAYWNSTNTTTGTGNYSLSKDGTGPIVQYPAGWATGSGHAISTANFVPNSATDGFINVFVKDESGAKYTSLYVNGYGSTAQSTQRLFPTGSPFYFGTSDNYWVTDYVDSTGQYAYPVGTYSVWAESALNNMKDNYKNNGADYTGKTVSAVGTVTLISDTVKIEANKDSVVRSKSFSVTVTGKPATNYTIWVKDTNSMDSSYDEQPPMVQFNQEKVYMDTSSNAYNGIHPIGNYAYENGAGATVWDNVASGGAWNRTRYYANITTSSSGTRTVEFVTTNWTKAQKYTIHVEAYIGGDYKSDEVDINVEKGAVTIVAAGDQSYYLGEEIKLSGTNTETYKTYLFLVGPNLPSKGAVIFNADPRNALYGSTFSPSKTSKGVINNDAETFKAVDVNGDNTWSWKWGTANYALDAGTYTIYAVSQPYDKENLENAAYGTVSIIIKKPFVSATASQSTVAKGDSIFITGTAEGDPGTVQIWILGKNFANKYSTSVNSDSSFKYEVKQETTKTMSSGQYFVVVQHPMQNKVFDVDLSGNYVVNKQLLAYGSTATAANYTRIFTLLGSGSLQGSDAAEALAEGINDANVDDTYTKLQFLIEEPTITIDTIGDKHVGDKFTITAKTNLAVDDEVLVQVYSSSFKPTMKSQSGEFSGATGTIKVTKGDSGYNKLSFDVDSSTFKPDEYIVTEDAVLQSATGTALFNVLETSVKTVVPTTAGTAVQTPVQSAVPTTVATAVATTTAPKSPGFGALVALIGLGAVAFVVVRRH